MLTARIAVVVSGGGTNLQALIDAQGRGVLQSGSIALVVADRAGIGAIARAEKAGIPCVTIVRKEAGFEEGVLSAFREHGIDMAVLAGFLGIFSADFIRRFSGPSSTSIPPSSPPSAGRGSTACGSTRRRWTTASRSPGPRSTMPARSWTAERSSCKRRWTSSPATRRRFCKKE